MSTESTERIEQTASDWIARRDAESWSPEDQGSFDTWFNESMEHRVAYWRLESAWDTTSRLKALGAGIATDRPPPPGQWNLSPFFTQRAEPTSPQGQKSRLRVRALAASLVLACALGVTWLLWPASNHYETPVGATASLPMEDGSKVILNTHSEIKVEMTEKERRIELEQGEAFFEVAKDPTRPFVVVAGDKRVVAVGTKFSVRRESGKQVNGIQVVVTEGTVRVESANGEGVEDISAKPLTAGTVVHANRDGMLVQQKGLPEAEDQLAWRSGMLVFRNVTLADAVAEFNRYNERKIVIEDAQTAGLRIEGNFRTTYVEAFVRLLEQGYPVRTRFEDDRIVVDAR